MKTLTQFLLTLTTLYFISCKSPNSPDEQWMGVLLEKNMVADAFGNRDSVTTTDELQAVDNYFAKNDSGWCLFGYLPGPDTATSVSADGLKQQFRYCWSQLFPTQKALRDTFQGVGFRCTWLSIMLLQENKSQIYVTMYFRSPGGYVSEHVWTRLPIID